ncbi:hypothetical protein [Paenibacillus cineris]|uniref:hypothetical protein n=1 Tax=Paenibacillus cineris TaxID=237530 RepID=UPI001B169E8A|nr:hypothetical protein [Paenibacillus cineris]GIO60245.1 hypothetical protein J43TS9_18190 [Paenibacillus cineris]
MYEKLQDMDLFLRSMHELETRIRHMIQRSGLSDKEQQFILDHILVIPGKDFSYQRNYG